MRGKEEILEKSQIYEVGFHILPTCAGRKTSGGDFEAGGLNKQKWRDYNFTRVSQNKSSFL